MAESIERYFRFLTPKAHGFRSGGGRTWCPSADVYRTREGWLVKVELAGIRLDEIEIEIAGDELHLAGTRRDGGCTETLSYHQLEITYSRFEKSIRFPCPIEGVKVETRYQDGLLLLLLRSPEECE